jgi:hypothetical protein
MLLLSKSLELILLVLVGGYISGLVCLLFVGMVSKAFFALHMSVVGHFL